MKCFIDGTEVTYKEFKKQCRLNMNYDEYKELNEKGTYNTSGNVFVIELENGMPEWDIMSDNWGGAEVQNNTPIFAKTKEDALAEWKNKYPDDDRRLWAIKHNVMSQYEFEGYASDEDMYNDYYPSRPIEL